MKWDITPRRVRVLCETGRIEGVAKLGREWAIPIGAERPIDKRLRAYTKFVGDYPDYDVDVKLCAFTSSEMQEAVKVYESQGLKEG